MNKTIYGILGAAFIALAGGCSKDLPFDGPGTETGTVMRESLNVSVNNAEHLVRSAGSEADINDVMVSFLAEGETVPYVTYRYGDMAEIVTLPVGVYTVEAEYGDNESAAWDAPYYTGSSSKFNVIADRTTTDISPIVCTLSNVKVSILFDDGLKEAMGAGSHVSVKVGESGELDFTPADSEREGYFRFDANTSPDAKNTLAATFIGTIGGAAVSETKTYDDVAPGNHYRITFRLHNHDVSLGGVDAGLSVDASVETVDKDGNIIPEDELLTDDSRPSEGDPGPVVPPVVGEGPEFSVTEGLSLTEVNPVSDGMECVIYVKSETGITEFKVDIISPTLTPDELAGVGLTDKLDLVNPGIYLEGLEGLGFPVNVGGQKDCEFVLTDFLGLLGALGPAVHTFRMTVSDTSGTKTIDFKLQTF